LYRRAAAGGRAEARQQAVRLRHIDRPAAPGMRFTQAYSGNAVCAPARCVPTHPEGTKRQSGLPRGQHAPSAAFPYKALDAAGP